MEGEAKAKEADMKERTAEILAKLGAGLVVFVMVTCWNALVIKLVGSQILDAPISWGLSIEAGAAISVLGNTWSIILSD